MNSSNSSRPDSSPLALVSSLLLASSAEKDPAILEFTHEQFSAMLSLAHSHHVVVRLMETLRGILANTNDRARHAWATEALEHETERISRAISRLADIFEALGSEGCGVTVIKSLDHWPDLGSDLDLYTDADPAEVIHVMTNRLDAQIATRSWGDRLANKWNFILPGLPEFAEVHMGRLGQTGELVALASSLAERARLRQVGQHCFRVTAPEDRLMICTLQRMYRHFYIRLCDIVDTVHLLETEGVNYRDLRSLAQESGIWEGVATFLCIVSDYARRYRGEGVALPSTVRSAARFGGEKITFARGFLRVPILPHSVRLYASEWTTLASQGQFRNTARLSLLPWLATAAALGQKITGSDKGIW